MKLTIVTRKHEDGWEVGYTCDGPLRIDAEPRVLTRSGAAGAGFPLPPRSEETLWAGKLHAELIDAADLSVLRKLYEETIGGESEGNSIEKFGRYLSAVLLGGLWPQVDAAAGTDPVELDLYFEGDDTELHRLPWEIMYGTGRPLCADTQRTVAITRFIIPQQAGVVARAPALPLKVLFVIGMPLDDNLRPGAEYLGLLRRMNVPLRGLKGQVESVDLNLRLLLDATIETLKDAVASFRPDVVHFICHGQVVAGKSSIHLTKLVGKKKEPDPCDAAHLLDYVRCDDGALPQIVVLNACRTADPVTQVVARNSSVGEGAYLSFAAQLVAGGVPVAIGMAGEIADGACRIFTRSFYQALISGESISLAAAQGRRAALLHYSSKISDYLTSIEWARPTLFLAEGVPSSLSVDTEGENEMRALTHAATRYRRTQTSPAILCDRFECWKDYQEFCDSVRRGATCQVLSFGVDESLCPDGAQFGMTRLLEEMAARAVLDGFVPCFIQGKERGQDPPANMLLFALRLADAIDEARENFKLPKRRSRAVIEAFALVPGAGPIPADPVDFEKAKGRVIQVLSKYESLDQCPTEVKYTTEVIRNIMIEDLRYLRCAVRRKWRGMRVAERGPERTARPGGPTRLKTRKPALLVMIDDLHLYPPAVSAALLKDFVTQDGLGNRKMKIPMIFTYKYREGNVTEMAHPVKRYLRQNPASFMDSALKPFQGPHEDMLAYGQYFLSAEPPLAVNWRADKQVLVKLVFKQMRRAIKGYPSGFATSDELQLIREDFSDPETQALLEADDERYVRELLRQ